MESGYGYPLEAINLNKVRHLYNTAKYFLYINRIYNNCIRFDAIEILLKNGKFNIRHIKQII